MRFRAEPPKFVRDSNGIVLMITDTSRNVAFPVEISSGDWATGLPERAHFVLKLAERMANVPSEDLPNLIQAIVDVIKHGGI